MSPLQGNAWELPLLSQASEALNSAVMPVQATVGDDRLLSRGYRYSEQITAMHSRSFYLASGLLPAEKRAAARALYAFCRVSDNVVDEGDGDAATAFGRWRARALSMPPPVDDLVLLAWADARARFHIPWRYSEQLLDGVARDLVQSRYNTFDELAAYAYGVASTVGLMSMHITGFRGPRAIPYAVKLGVALQLTNILRDVGQDYARGRVYLPQAELAAFGLSEADLAAGRVTERWRGFMRFQIARNRRLYNEAWPGIGLLDANGRLAIAAATGLYRAILGQIEANDYDVFHRRAHLGMLAKMRRLPGLWWRSRGFQFREAGTR